MKVLSLSRENIFNHSRQPLVGAWCGRHLLAAVAYHAISFALGRLLGQSLANALQLVAQPPHLWRVYPQFPRTSCHSATSQDYLGLARVAYDWLLHLRRCCAVVVGATADVRPCLGHHLAYPLVQNSEKVERKGGLGFFERPNRHLYLMRIFRGFTFRCERQVVHSHNLPYRLLQGDCSRCRR